MTTRRWIRLYIITLRRVNFGRSLVTPHRGQSSNRLLPSPVFTIRMEPPVVVPLDQSNTTTRPGVPPRFTAGSTNRPMDGSASNLQRVGYGGVVDAGRTCSMGARISRAAPHGTANSSPNLRPHGPSVPGFHLYRGFGHRTSTPAWRRVRTSRRRTSRSPGVMPLLASPACVEWSTGIRRLSVMRPPPRHFPMEPGRHQVRSELDAVEDEPQADVQLARRQ